MPNPAGFVKLDGNTMAASKERVVAPEADYDLEISDADQYTGEKSGKTSLRVTFKFIRNSDYANFRQYFGWPDPVVCAKIDEEKGEEPGTTLRNRIVQWKRLFHHFGVKWGADGFDIRALKGKKARTRVTQELNEDANPPRTDNRINLPQLPNGVN